MMNNLLSVIVVGGLVGTFILAPTPEPAPRSVASRPAPSDQPAAVSPAIVASNTWRRSILRFPSCEALARCRQRLSLRRRGQTRWKCSPRTVRTRQPPRAAIEADGYKGVTVLGKGTDGTWRAKAYRGKTEVQLTVDGTGRVSTE